jgi:hypothetical protein
MENSPAETRPQPMTGAIPVPFLGNAGARADPAAAGPYFLGSNRFFAVVLVAATQRLFMNGLKLTRNSFTRNGSRTSPT